MKEMLDSYLGNLQKLDVPVDETLGVVVPVVAYWAYSGIYSLVEIVDPKLFHASRLHTMAEEQKNLVSRTQVVRGVLFQQALQIITASVMLFMDPFRSKSPQLPSLWVQLVQVAVAMLVMDSWQYFMHRLFHESRFLYQHFHSWHHRLLVPYSYGALYNHPIEGLLLDTIGGALAYVASGMAPRTSVFFFTLATLKTVDDHCGLFLPFNPFQRLFQNNSAYHDIHHQLSGFRFNYSQPFFPLWDYVLGTHMPFTLIRRPDGGLEARSKITDSLLSKAKARDAAACCNTGKDGKVAVRGSTEGAKSLCVTRKPQNSQGLCADCSVASGAPCPHGTAGCRAPPDDKKLL